MRLETRAQFTREMMESVPREVMIENMARRLSRHLIENSNVELIAAPLDGTYDVVEWRLVMNINE